MQADPSTFERVVLQVQQRSGNASPAAATCDTASVRSLDTTADREIDVNEPQDLSMGGAMSSASSVSEMTAGDDPAPSTSKGQGCSCVLRHRVSQFHSFT